MLFDMKQSIDRHKPNKIDHGGAAHGITGWKFKRIVRLALVALVLVSSLLGTAGFALPAPAYADGEVQPLPAPTEEPSPAPTAEPSPIPTAEPSPIPTAEPSPTPTAEPSPTPTAEPSPTPTAEQSPTPAPEQTIPVTLYIYDARAEGGLLMRTLDVPCGGTVAALFAGVTVTLGEESVALNTLDWYIMPDEDAPQESAEQEDAEQRKYDLAAPVTVPLALYALTAQPVLSVRAAPADTAAAKTVKFYVALNGAWTELTDKATTDKSANFTNGGERYYITAAELASVYHAYGFTDESYIGGLFFPHTDDNDRNNIWANAAPQQDADGNGWLIPLGETKHNHADRPTYYVYYTPNNTPNNTDGHTSYFTASKEINNDALLADNSLYTVKVNGGGKTGDATLPPPRYVLSGNTAIVEDLPALDESVSWKVLDQSGNEVTGVTVTKNADGISTVTITNVRKPLTVTAMGENELVVVYNAGVEKVQIKDFATDAQTVTQNGAVKGQETYHATASNNAPYTLLAPDSARAAVTAVQYGKARTLYYSFKGWRVTAADGSTVTFQPKDVLTGDQINTYLNGGLVLTLTAVWSPFERNTGGTDLIATANFYVHLDCEVAGNLGSGWQPNTGAGNYSGAIYSTRVFGEAEKTPDSDGFTVVAVPSDAQTAAQTDAEIRDAVNKPKHGLKLESFPTDGEIFAALKAQNAQIRLNGETLPAGKLSDEHFTIRWYTAKYVNSDGYHVDGVLVEKAARLVVSKTFTGDKDVIDAVRGNGSYKIEVTHQEKTGTVKDYTLVLKPKDDSALAQGETGYADYKEENGTYKYTWVLAGYQNRQYTVRESGCEVPDAYKDKYSHTARYSVLNPYTPNGSTPADNAPYPAEGVIVTVTSYAKDIPDDKVQTVALRSVYERAAALTLRAQSGTGDSGTPISGAKFTLYSDKACTQAIGDPSTTDAKGEVRLSPLTDGEYYLKETAAPAGYRRLDTVLALTVDGGAISLTAGTTALDGWALTGAQDSGYTLTATNEALQVLPSTGGAGVCAHLALGIALMCTSAVLLLRPKKQRA